MLVDLSYSLVSKSWAFRRLQYLKSRFTMHTMLNEMEELGASLSSLSLSLSLARSLARSLSFSFSFSLSLSLFLSLFLSLSLSLSLYLSLSLSLYVYIYIYICIPSPFSLWSHPSILMGLQLLRKRFLIAISTTFAKYEPIISADMSCVIYLH